MKVQIKKDFVRQGKKWKKGQVVEFTNDLALELIESGKADQADSPTDDEIKFEVLRNNNVYENEEEEN